MYEEGNYVDNLISNNAIEQEQKEMTDLLALHFRDTSRNREEQLSYPDWQDVVGAAWTEPEEAAATAYRFEWLQEDMEKNPEDYHAGKYSTIQCIFSAFVTSREIFPGWISNSR